MTMHHKHDEFKTGLWFSIEIAEDEFVVFISAEALSIHFKAANNRKSQLAAYKKNRSVIDAMARRKLLNGCPRPIHLANADFSGQDKASASDLNKHMSKAAMSMSERVLENGRDKFKIEQH